MDILSLDLASFASVREAAAELNRRYDKIDILINNAGIIHPIRLVGEAEASEKIIRSINVNLTAAMLITDRFVRETEQWSVPRKVMNLSSGAAQRTVKAWSAYCAAKAGLEMYSKCLFDEQQGLPNPVKLVSFSPGVVNTEMQEEIRNSSPEHFPELDRFKEMKENGRLLEPAFVAERILELLDSPHYGEKCVLHINELL